MFFNYYNLYSPYMLEEIKKHKPVLNIYIFEAWADCPLEQCYVGQVLITMPEKNYNNVQMRGQTNHKEGI